jgi:hypothetical protein
LGFHHEVKRFTRDLAERAADMVIRDGFPKNGINFLHKKVLEEVAKDCKIVADGTRRDDRAPWLEVSEIRGIEDKYDVEYVAPLRGIGHRSLKKLASKYFEYQEGESENQQKGDYETEIRAIIKERGYDIREFFPAHVQSRVVRRF